MLYLSPAGEEHEVHAGRCEPRHRLPQWPLVLWQRPAVERHAQHLRAARLELGNQLLVGNTVLQDRHPQALDGGLCVERGKDLAPSVGLGHADLGLETEFAQLSDRLGPTRDQRRACQRCGQALGRATLREGAQTDPSQHDHHFDPAGL